MLKSYSLVILLLFALIACNQPSNTPIEAVQARVELPKTPEEVVRTWEFQIDKNQFDKARLISTGPTLDLVNSLAETDSLEHSEEMYTQIINIRCTENENEAFCNCELKDEFGSIRYKYHLLRQKGQWFLNDVVPESKNTSANLDASLSPTMQ